MRVLVTGAGGFLGQRVARSLLERNHDVVALDSRALDGKGMGWPESRVRCVQADLASGAPLDQAMEGMQAVIHLAMAMRAPDAEQIASARSGTQQVVDAMERAGVGRLVLASSVTVYDWLGVNGPVSETATLEQNAAVVRDGYAQAKLIQEQIAEEWAARSRGTLVVLRPGIIWGEGAWDLSQLGQRLGPVRMLIGPRRPLSLTHVVNCADAFAAAVEPGVGSTILNIVDGAPVEAREYERMARGAGLLSGVTVPVPYGLARCAVRTIAAAGLRRGPKILRPACFAARFAAHPISGELAKGRLAWSPRVDMAQGMRLEGAKSPS